MSDPAFLSADQARRFVADGFIVIQSGLELPTHARIETELRELFRGQGTLALADNVLPSVPSLNQILEAPAVRDAVASVLGPDFAWAPHRFPHNSEPTPQTEPIDAFADQPEMGAGSISGSGWHQDGHYRGGRCRWQTFRAANVFYFPRDTPIEMGPTRLLAGSHLYANLNCAQRAQAVFRPLPAGTVIVADFDLGHAGSPNRTDQARYMVKFVALRTNGRQAMEGAGEWQTPVGLASVDDTPNAWRSIWNWQRGASRHHGIDPASNMNGTIAALGSADAHARLESIYRLSATEAAVRPLLAALRGTAGQGRHESPDPGSAAYRSRGPDPAERRFSFHQFVPEDATIALAAMGEPALTALVELTEDDDPWMRMNAAWALGDGSLTGQTVHAALSRLLADGDVNVVRVTLDALCANPAFGEATVRQIATLLQSERPEWCVPAPAEPRVGTTWRARDQVRFLCAWALTNRATLGDPPPELERALTNALADDTDYVPAVACEGLGRVGTASALRAAFAYLQRRRWDTTGRQLERLNTSP